MLMLSSATLESEAEGTGLLLTHLNLRKKSPKYTLTKLLFGLHLCIKQKSPRDLKPG